MGLTSRQGQVRVTQVSAKERLARIVSRKENHGRKTVGLKIGEGVAINRDITIIRIGNGRHGCIQLLIDAPLSAVLGDPEVISLTS